MQETWVPSLGREDPLQEEMATHASILAWETPRTEELGGLQSVGSQKNRTRLGGSTTTISETTVGYAASTSRRLLEAVKKVRIYMFQVLKLGNGSKMN